MSSKIDGVIAALRVALNEAERSNVYWWKARAANRWINQLPGAWMGRWWHLRLRTEFGEGGSIARADFIGHVRATLAYLEANREEIRSRRAWSWATSRPAKKPHSGPVDTKAITTEAGGNDSFDKPRPTKH
jgi:hypothetical protein